jgi:hypothetical protein
MDAGGATDAGGVTGSDSAGGPGDDAGGAADSVGIGDAPAGEDSAAAEDAGPPPECGEDSECAGKNASGPCQVDYCSSGSCAVGDAPDDTVCDDGNACTAGDGCAAGVCTGGAVDCNDGDPCTTDSCDPAAGCVFTAADPNNPPAGCGLGCKTAADCDDGNACTIDLCGDGGGCTNPMSFQCDACNNGPTCAGTPLPSWSLQDVNPTSPTLGQQVAPAAFLGQPVLIYSVHGYCPTCALRAKELGPVIADVNAKGANVKMIVVNQKEYASNITNVAKQGDFAMVNDNVATDAFGEMGVPSKEYLLIYDKAGKLVTWAAPWEWSVNKAADIEAISGLLTDLGAQ